MDPKAKFPWEILVFAFVPLVYAVTQIICVEIRQGQPAVGDLIQVQAATDLPLPAPGETKVVAEKGGWQPTAHCTLRAGPHGGRSGSLLVIRHDASGNYLVHWQAQEDPPTDDGCGRSAYLDIPEQELRALRLSQTVQTVLTRSFAGDASMLRTQ